MNNYLRQIHQDALSIAPAGSLIVGVNKGMFVREVELGMKTFCDQTQAGPVTISTSFKDISIGLRLDRATVKVSLRKNPLELRVSLAGILTFFHPDHPEKLYRDRLLTVNETAFTIEADPYGKTGVRFVSVYRANDVEVSHPGAEPDPDLVNNYYGGDVAQYKADESGLVSRVSDSVIGGLMSFLKFPPIKAQLQQFKLGSDLAVTADVVDYILLYGTPQLNSAPCPYVPRNEPGAAILSSEKLPALGISSCGEVPASGAPEFFIVYPKATTLDALGQARVTAGLAVSADDDALFTLYYYSYDIVAQLQSAVAQFASAPPSMTVDTKWKLSGGGSVGAVAACTKLRSALVTVTLTNSTLDTAIKVEPCMDDRALYLKTSTPNGANYDLHWNTDAVLAEILKNAVKNAIDGFFSRTILSKVADAMQVALLDVGGWWNRDDTGRTLHVWSQDILADSLLIAASSQQRD
ncbi:hypothetical protein PQR57_45250 [Paraburkholderia dipogonis]|uniref:DUF4043 family protein n=1 Tax=Paraburkholderia dipogonis TaxID=1211383 RepID=A0ABW9B5B5_9BURK